MRIQLGGLVIVDPLPAVLAGRWNKRERARIRRRFPGCVVVEHHVSQEGRV